MLFEITLDSINPEDVKIMLHMIGHMIFGLIVGIIAKFLMPGHDPGGIIVTMLLGIAGAWVGGFLGRTLGLYKEGHPAGFLMAILGAIILLFIYHLAAGRGTAAFLVFGF